jgi:hypothetical protein
VAASCPAVRLTTTAVTEAQSPPRRGRNVENYPGAAPDSPHGIWNLRDWGEVQGADTPVRSSRSPKGAENPQNHHCRHDRPCGLPRSLTVRGCLPSEEHQSDATDGEASREAAGTVVAAVVVLGVFGPFRAWRRGVAGRGVVGRPCGLPRSLTVRGCLPSEEHQSDACGNSAPGCQPPEPPATTGLPRRHVENYPGAAPDSPHGIWNLRDWGEVQGVRLTTTAVTEAQSPPRRGRRSVGVTLAEAAELPPAVLP